MLLVHFNFLSGTRSIFVVAAEPLEPFLNIKIEIKIIKLFYNLTNVKSIWVIL